MFHPTLVAKKKKFGIFNPKLYLMMYECSHLTKNTQFPLQERHRCLFQKPNETH